jgi:hypothetical protein
MQEPLSHRGHFRPLQVVKGPKNIDNMSGFGSADFLILGLQKALKKVWQKQC